MDPKYIEYARKKRDSKQRVVLNVLRTRRVHLGETSRQQKRKLKALRRLAKENIGANHKA